MKYFVDALGFVAHKLVGQLQFLTVSMIVNFNSLLYEIFM